MALKWENVSATMWRLLDDPDVFDTGWRVVFIREAGNWLAYRRTWTYAPVEFKKEAEARAFAESTYILESSNGA